MSGMGGLNLVTFFLMFVIQGLKAVCYSIVSSCYRKPFTSSLQFIIAWLTASGYIIIYLQHTLLFGKPLTAFSTKDLCENLIWLRVMNLGTVIMKRIGQPACLLSKGATLAYDRASETERAWVINDGLSNRKWLKIQSSF